MNPKLTLLGAPLSPYVRKVMTVCALKGLTYQIDPFPPFFGGERFTTVSPLRRIPVLIDDIVTLSDSSVICQYLEDRYPTPSVYPADIGARAEARWLEEYADTRMGDVFIWKIFNEACIKPAVWGATRDLPAIARAVAVDLPEVMDYLEHQAPAAGFKYNVVSIADISVAVLFRNLHWSRVVPDASRWPLTMAWVARVEALAAMRDAISAADHVLRLPPLEMPEAMRGLGFAVTSETMAAAAAPRRGPMSV